MNLSSGCIDNHLYIYNLNTKVLSDSIGFSNEEELRDFIMIKNNLFVLLNDYSRKYSKIIKYDLQLKRKTDSSYVFIGKKCEHIYANKFIKTNDDNSSAIYFLLTTGLRPHSVFPLVGSYNIDTKKTSFIKCWYPFIKDIKNKEFYVNDAFDIRNKLFVAYESTPYCSELDSSPDKIRLVRMKSFLLDSLFYNNDDSLENILKSNYFYYDNNRKVVIEKKGFYY